MYSWQRSSLHRRRRAPTSRSLPKKKPSLEVVDFSTRLQSREIDRAVRRSQNILVIFVPAFLAVLVIPQHDARLVLVDGLHTSQSAGRGGPVVGREVRAWYRSSHAPIVLAGVSTISSMFIWRPGLKPTRRRSLPILLKHSHMALEKDVPR